jgi:aminoglycoside phosphotransferase family enzyme/predicted kinase
MCAVLAKVRAEAGSAGGSEGAVALLSEAAAYDDQPSRVERIETHISWVFLTDRFAYKLKKPVRFDFLDFSTPELRRRACEEEVRLNRRLARQVYLGVVPVVHRGGDQKVLALGGKGAPVDWVVKMRRLPADRALDRLIRAAAIDAADVRRIGHTLTEFFTQIPPLYGRADDYRRRLEAHVRDNHSALLQPGLELPAADVRRIHEAQLRLLLLAPELFGNRVLDGRIVEGHGDLRPEHIYLAPQPTIIDCIEFSAELRELDVLDELCFLGMECARLNADWVGDDVISQYCERANDHPPPELPAFYKCYRACVRAKVTALRAAQLAGQARREELSGSAEYLELADRFREMLGPPLLLVVRGLTGVGKSTLARHLSERFGFELLQTDAVRRELFGRSETAAAYDEAIYEPENRARVYDELFKRAGALLNNGCSVVLDGTFLSTASRSEAARLAADARAALLVVHCLCPDAVASARIAARLESGGSCSESRPDIHARQKVHEETDVPGLPACRVNTTECPAAISETILARLRSAR